MSLLKMFPGYIDLESSPDFLRMSRTPSMDSAVEMMQQMERDRPEEGEMIFRIGRKSDKFVCRDHRVGHKKVKVTDVPDVVEEGLREIMKAYNEMLSAAQLENNGDFSIYASSKCKPIGNYWHYDHANVPEIAAVTRLTPQRPTQYLHGDVRFFEWGIFSYALAAAMSFDKEVKIKDVDRRIRRLIHSAMAGKRIPNGNNFGLASVMPWVTAFTRDGDVHAADDYRDAALNPVSTYDANMDPRVIIISPKIVSACSERESP